MLSQKWRRMAVGDRRAGHFHGTGQQTYRRSAICRVPHFMNHFTRDDLRVLEHLLEIIDRTAPYVLGLELLQPKSPGTCGDDRIKDFRELLTITDTHLV